jgi:hypothetical protein
LNRGRAVAGFDAAMILLQSVIEILAVAMPHTLRPGSSRSLEDTVVPIRANRRREHGLGNQNELLFSDISEFQAFNAVWEEYSQLSHRDGSESRWC